MNVLSAENTDTRAFLTQLIEQISCSDNTIIIIASSRTEKDSSSVASECHSDTHLFSRITPQAYAEGRAQSVEDELRLASIHAPSLIKAIRTNEALGDLDTTNLKSSELYHLLDDHYHLPFKQRNFTKYRNKRSTN